MSSAADYAGRTYDVCAFHGLVESGESLLSHELADEGGGEICTGAAKLAQRVVLRLLTRRGTVRFRPNEGSSFMTRLLGGMLRNEQAVAAAFRLAAGEIQAACTAEVTATTPDDERLVRIDLLGVEFRPGGEVAITFENITAAGPARPIILPIRTKP